GGAWVGDLRPESQSVADQLLTGGDSGRLLDLKQVPWDALWPTIRGWFPLIVTFSLASLCLALIVHPQWSRNELLPYPIVNVVCELTRRSEGQLLPDVIHCRLFWVGFVAILMLHVINGLAVWYLGSPSIPLIFDFTPLIQLWPAAGRAPLGTYTFTPRIYPSAVAMMFFVIAPVSLSLGLSHYVFTAIGAIAVSRGVYMPYTKFSPNAMNEFRFGAFVAAGVVIAYIGRAFYGAVARAAIGLRHSKVPTYSIWATRMLPIFLALSVAMLVRFGLDWILATLLISMCLLVTFVLARIVSETGLFFVSNPFVPVAVFLGVLGFDVVGPTGLLLVSVAGFLLIGDMREALLPYLINSLKLAERAEPTSDLAKRAPRLITPALVAMMLLSLGIAGVVTLGIQYSRGADRFDTYARDYVPRQPFDVLAVELSEAEIHSDVAQSISTRGVSKLTLFDPLSSGMLWSCVGAATVLLFAVARLRIAWWPLHPVMFLVLGMWIMAMLGFSCLLGWFLKTLIVRLGGTRALRLILPMAVGVIAADLAGAMLWMIVGTIFFTITGTTPPSYWVFP
ncbi:MAG: hypothetical protein MI725_06455, partial [Pirellulales bacterium]|nr:hypothetical protein [Pirellulales bacterium]